MSYDEDLAFRLMGQLLPTEGVLAKEMFGGLAFLLHGHMAVAALGSGGLMVRLGPDDAEAALAEPFVEPMEMGAGRRPKGWIRVREAGYESDEALARWVEAGLAFAGSLPPK